LIAHLGGDWPRGATLGNDRIPGLVRAEGGPITIATEDNAPQRRWLVINRDRKRARRIQLQFAPGIELEGVYRPAPPDSGLRRVPDPRASTLAIDLAPGESVVLKLFEH
jgi:hypothetical protein